MLIRVGDNIINMDNVLQVDLNWENEVDGERVPTVVFEFNILGQDELEDGVGHTSPYMAMFEGEEGEAIRRYLKEKIPDLRK